MLKDRIKELMRFYFAQKISAKYYDNKTSISIKELEIGMTKEGFDYILDSNVPKDILRVRNRIPLIESENRYANEKIILYRKTVTVNRKLLDKSSIYNIDGIVEVIRLNMLLFMRKTDNPEVPLFLFNDNLELEQIMGIKNYYLNIIFQYEHQGEENFKRYRVGFNRDGINIITEMKV
jgi:hypothetical protein